MRKIKKLLFLGVLIGIGLLFSQERTYAAEMDTPSENESATSDALENSVLIYSNDDFSIYVEKSEPSVTRSSYSVVHTFRMTDSSNTITYVKWDAQINYSYSDGNYVTINSVDVTPTINYQYATAYPYTFFDYVHISNYSSWSCVNIDYDVTLVENRKKYSLSLYAEVDYWGEFSYAIYDR